MQGHPDVIEKLNQALTIELTAINQYFAQAKMCKNWGFDRLAAKQAAGSYSAQHDKRVALLRTQLSQLEQLQAGLPVVQTLPAGRVPRAVAQ